MVFRKFTRTFYKSKSSWEFILILNDTTGFQRRSTFVHIVFIHDILRHPGFLATIFFAVEGLIIFYYAKEVGIRSVLEGDQSQRKSSAGIFTRTNSACWFTITFYPEGKFIGTIYSRGLLEMHQRNYKNTWKIICHKEEILQNNTNFHPGIMAAIFGFQEYSKIQEEEHEKIDQKQ